MENSEHVKNYYDRELEKGRRKRTTCPLTDQEWDTVKMLVDELRDER